MRQPASLEGVGLALASALAFGLTVPWVARSGEGVGPFTTACLLYAGAALVSALLRAVERPAARPPGRAEAGRILCVAAAGAFVAPVAFAWGVQASGPTAASFLLNLEAPFTTLLAARMLGEPIGRRVALALTAMAAGGALIALDRGSGAGWAPLGVGAVALASLAWATDNALSRPLAELEPLAVVRAKGTLGALASGGLALVASEPLPAVGPALALLACGATGYGLSLRLYLLAQRRVGAARTASVFAMAPFLGAAASWALGDRALGPGAVVGALAFAVGVILHATERHVHAHVHEATRHDHPHRHDDGHHEHSHETAPDGSHAHEHAHERVEHCHDHMPDAEHDHHRRPAAPPGP